MEQGRHKWAGVLVLALLAIFLGSIFWMDPERNIYALKCPFYLLTGWQCPSCGIQRAFYALLHGHFMEAISYNFFMVLSVPYALLLVVVTWFDPKHRLMKLKRICYHPVTVYSYVFLFFLWWIIRNVTGI